MPDIGCYYAPVGQVNRSYLPRSVAIDSKSDDRPAPDYATAASRPKSSAMSPVAAIVGTVAGLFGALMLFYGVGGIVWLVRDWRRVDGEDVFAVAMFNVVGGLSAFFAVRWIRSALKGPPSAAGR